MNNILRIKRKLSIILVGILAFIGIAATGAAIYSESTVRGISDNVIRLHIMAESDSDIDQEVKLEVRDRVMDYLTGKIDLSDSVPETVSVIKDEIPNIEEIAKEVLIKNGHPAAAKAEYGNFAFPTSKYENLEIPAGYYNALKIILGDGSGQNWWCVVFPPLCFADSSNGKINSDADAKLKESLSTDQYNIITSTGEDENIPVKFKFKIVEVVQDAKTVISNFFSGIFG